MNRNKIIVITGPTATGKSALAVELAKTLNGGVISADSRQVYRGLDIGSAKITSDEMCGIPHHLIDIADPKEIFTVAEFKELADEKIAEIHARGKLPIICGGTGMYISAVIDNQIFPEVAPDEKLRDELEQLSAEELFEKLKELDPVRAETIDKHNPVRLIRSIEIAKTIGAVPPLVTDSSNLTRSPDGAHPLLEGEGAASIDFDDDSQGSHPSPSRRGVGGEVLIIGLRIPKDELDARIAQRITDRIPALFDEIRKLHTTGITSDRLHRLGLEYRYGDDYVTGKLLLPEFIETLTTKTIQFAKRQMTWWKRDERVHWMNPVTDKQKILKLVQDFLG